MNILKYGPKRWTGSILKDEKSMGVVDLISYSMSLLKRRRSRRLFCAQEVKAVYKCAEKKEMRTVKTKEQERRINSIARKLKQIRITDNFYGIEEAEKTKT